MNNPQLPKSPQNNSSVEPKTLYFSVQTTSPLMSPEFNVQTISLNKPPVEPTSDVQKKPLKEKVNDAAEVGKMAYDIGKPQNTEEQNGMLEENFEKLEKMKDVVDTIVINIRGDQKNPFKGESVTIKLTQNNVFDLKQTPRMFSTDQKSIVEIPPRFGDKHSTCNHQLLYQNNQIVGNFHKP